MRVRIVCFPGPGHATGTDYLDTMLLVRDYAVTIFWRVDRTENRAGSERAIILLVVREI